MIDSIGFCGCSLSRELGSDLFSWTNKPLSPPSHQYLFKVHILMYYCRSRMGDLAGALLSSEMALECDINTNNKHGSKLTISGNVLDQYVIAACKTDPPNISHMLPRLALSEDNQICFVEEILKTHQRLSASSYLHQLVVVEALLLACKRREHPIKHGRALVEKAKLLRFAPASDASVSQLLVVCVFMPCISGLGLFYI